MDASTLFISGIIQSDTILRIPYFQRRYVWENADWERFAKDMESTLDSDHNYFLGAVIFKVEDVNQIDRRNGIAKKFLVVDGQQRLTTLIIFMKVLYMLNAKHDDFSKQYLQDSKEPVLRHSCDDSRDFRSVMNLDTASEIKQGTGNIIRAYNYFLEYLIKARDKRAVNLLELLNMVKSAITFVVITLQPEDDEQQIFDTINSLGVPLTTDELLKNFLYEAGDEDAYNRTWKRMFDDDKARKFWGTDASVGSQSKTKENRVIERFMVAFVRMKMWDFKDQLSDIQKKNYVKTEYIFRTFKDFVEKFNMNKQDLANEILFYADLYKSNLDASILDERIPSTFGIKRISCFINATKSYVVLPFVLYILGNVKDEKERNKMFGFLETYLIRRMLSFPSTYNKDYIGQFSEYTISNRINSFENLKKFFKEKTSTSNLRMPTDKEIVFYLGGKALDEISARLIFYMYETLLQPASNGTIDSGFNGYMTSQLMPKPNDKFDQYWPKHEDIDEEKERVKLIKTLGNYFLLDTDSDNKEIKKCVYAGLNDKVGVFRKFSIGITSSDAKLRNITEWKEGKINERNAAFAKKFCKDIWTV